jgi:hypothetical protein
MDPDHEISTSRASEAATVKVAEPPLIAVASVWKLPDAAQVPS